MNYRINAKKLTHTTQNAILIAFVSIICIIILTEVPTPLDDVQIGGTFFDE